MTSKLELLFPTGSNPGWELEEPIEEGEQPIQGIADSGVILQTLRQSRDRWIHKTFPKFSTRGRGNKLENGPPPHTMQFRGKCDLTIGPHIFLETSLYEVHYMAHAVRSTSSVPVQTSQSSWQSRTPYSSYTSTFPVNPSPATAASTSTINSAPGFSSTPAFVQDPSPAPPYKPQATFLNSGPPTQELINKVNYAASTTPALARLLRAAASGIATADEIRTLGYLIQSLATMDTDPAGSSSPSPLLEQQPTFGVSTATAYYKSYPTVPPVREFDLVLEFNEAPSERWLFPRVPVYVEKSPSTVHGYATYDIKLTTIVPFPPANYDKTETSTTDASSSVDLTLQHAQQFNLDGAPAAVWDTINRWLGGEEKVRANKEAIDRLPTRPPAFLSHRLKPGSLLDSIRSASAPLYAMKPLRQGPAPAPRPRPKRPPKKAVATDPPPSSDAPPPAEPIAEPPLQKAKEATKKPRVNKLSEPIIIKCHNCGKANVPLFYGGRLCEVCRTEEENRVAQGLPSLLAGFYTPPSKLAVTPTPTPTQPHIAPIAVTTAAPPKISALSVPIDAQPIFASTPPPAQSFPM